MRDLSRKNCYFYKLSRFYADLEVEMGLVFHKNMDNDDIKDFAIVIGEKRKIHIQFNTCDDVYMLVQKDNVLIAFDKVELIKDDVSQMEKIDIEGYLLSKDYTYAQLDSKSYAREKNRKKYIVSEHEINSYGIFEGSHTWLDIDVFNARASFFPNTYKIGENDMVYIAYSSFGEKLVEPIRALTMEKKSWDQDVFLVFFESIAKSNSGVIKTANGVVVFEECYGGEFRVERTFEDGEYSFRRKIERFSDDIDKWGEFTFAIMKSKSLEDCKNIEIKARMLGLIW
ncbi:MAG: hypothetical protein ACI4S2_06005 [Lachnospiraceae bacterium]